MNAIGIKIREKNNSTLLKHLLTNIGGANKFILK